MLDRGPVMCVFCRVCPEKKDQEVMVVLLERR